MDVAKVLIIICILFEMEVEAYLCDSDREQFQRFSDMDLSHFYKAINSFFAHHRCSPTQEILRYLILF